MRSGFVAVLGRTNVGKSTILNALIGRKVAITTPKKQTTRTLIRAILTKDDFQMVFIDTPGIHKPKYALGEEMNKKVHRALADADVAVLVVDAGRPFNEGDHYALATLKFNCPLIIVFNKIDTTTFVMMEELRAKYQERYPEAKLIETSAIRHFNIDLLEKTIYELLPEGPMYYPADYFVDTTQEFAITEIIREKTMLFTREEIPHSIAVSIDKIEHYDDGIDVYASINVEKNSQKGIIIGKGGAMIKKIRHAAQHDIHCDLKLPVRLELFVKVYQNWRSNPKALKELNLLEDE
ncbi:MAG: GTPase Era [Bacilli bacterium]